MKSAFITCTGCEQRDLDAERVRAFLKANGFAIADCVEDADLTIVVTCAVDERNERESLALLKEMASSVRASGRIVVGGCLPSINPKATLGFANDTFSPRTMEKLDSVLGDSLKVPMAEIPDANYLLAKELLTAKRGTSQARSEYEEAKRGFSIRINQGCLLSCSYCVIRFATGRLASVPVEAVTQAFEAGLAECEPTIMLVGGDTGAYGIDIGTNFSALLERLLRYDGDHQIFIHDFNVHWLLRDLREFSRVLGLRPGRLRGASIPVQSGSDRILKRMRRPYRANDVVRALRVVRDAAPELLVGSHIIVGYPGETEEDFRETLAFLEDVRFDFVTCFRYSEHALAPSAKHGGKVPEDEKRSRLSRIGELLGDSGVILT